MTEKGNIKNIIFDFGGVLFAIDYNLPIEAFRSLGYQQFADIYTQAAQNEMFDKLETGKVTSEAFMQYLHDFVPGVTRREVDEAWNSILLHILPEHVAFVRQLREQGYRTFLLSNTNAIHVKEFERMIDEKMGIDTFRLAFEKVYYSNEIGIKKPYPETFLKVCEWNGLAPAETLFIDDSLQHVNGAAKAGLHVLHLQPGEILSDVLPAVLGERREA